MLKPVRWKSFLAVIGSAALLLLFVGIRNGALVENLWANPVTYVVWVGIPAIVFANIVSFSGPAIADAGISSAVGEEVLAVTSHIPAETVAAASLFPAPDSKVRQSVEVAASASGGEGIGFDFDGVGFDF